MPTYGRFVIANLSENDGEQLFIPDGFANVFCCSSGNPVLAYKHSANHSKENDLGVLWNGPDLAISWPFAKADTVLSDKACSILRLTEISLPFKYILIH